jgi:hypothetical protein
MAVKTCFSIFLGRKQAPVRTEADRKAQRRGTEYFFHFSPRVFRFIKLHGSGKITDSNYFQENEPEVVDGRLGRF